MGGKPVPMAFGSWSEMAERFVTVYSTFFVFCFAQRFSIALL